jgi:hypothetical protein
MILRSVSLLLEPTAKWQGQRGPIGHHQGQEAEHLMVIRTGRVHPKPVEQLGPSHSTNGLKHGDSHEGWLADNYRP